MNGIILFGKKYMDTIMFVNCIKQGETNQCKNVIQKVGGLNNFYEVDFESWNIQSIFSGQKEAYIVSDRSNSQRTSYVFGNSKSTFDLDKILSLSTEHSWLHVCYIDDVECHSEISRLDIPFSLDFCTDSPRHPYREVMSRASIIFDSRERKKLYEDLDLDTPLILHDEYGIEIIQNKKIIFEEKNTPIMNIDVNGAGDIFAAIFIKNYATLSLFESAKLAMTKTTKLLLKRMKNEQEV